MTTPAPEPKVGDKVFYMSHGSADGSLPSTERVSLITDVITPYNVSLAVFNPTGVFFNTNVEYDETKSAATWHFPTA